MSQSITQSNSPCQDLFNVVEKDGLRLITPKHSIDNSKWNASNTHYRSRVETLVGTTISQGYRKFFNLGCGPEGLSISAEDVVKACERGDAWATLKLDGSLLIRSVYEGKVMLRTRGSFGYEHIDNEAEMGLFFEKYPALFDVDWYPQVSLLLEWTSPNNVIVLKYPEPDLTLIGAVVHKTMKYLPIERLKYIASDMCLPLVKHFELDAKGWAELNATLDSENEIEGYVIRLNNEQDLVKVKCAPYLTKHALKSTLSSEKLADMYFQQGRPEFHEFCTTFASSFDEETLWWAMGPISSMYDGVRELKAIESHMAKKAQGRQSLSRKEAALAGLAEYGQTKRFSAYMNLWEGKEVKTDLLKSILLQNTKQVEIGMFKKYPDPEGGSE